MSTDVDLELIREVHPQGSGASFEERRRARATLLAEIDNAGSFERRRTPNGFRLTLLPSIGLLGAMVVAAAVIVLAVELHGGAAQPASAAAAVLQRAARAAEASGGPRELRPGEYWYVHSRDTTLGVTLKDNHGVIANALGSIDRQVWKGLGVPGRITTHVIGPIDFLSPSARQQWEHAGRPAQTSLGDVSLSGDAFDLPYKQLLALPTNVDALWKVIQHGTGRRSASWQRHEMFTKIGDLLREDPVPAKVRAALYLVAARIPGIQLLGLTHDGIGRPALAITLNDAFYGQRDELLFDPRTVNLLGESQVVLKPGPKFHVKPGTVEFESTYLTSGIVQRIGQRPHR